MLIVEFGGVFSADDSDASSVSSHQMTISLKVDIPVQATYKPIPKNLYKELKYYVEDLLCNNWTTNSEFPYSSLIVVLRKKIVPSGCVVTSKNWMPIIDHYPLTRIQKTSITLRVISTSRALIKAKHTTNCIWILWKSKAHSIFNSKGILWIGQSCTWEVLGRLPWRLCEPLSRWLTQASKTCIWITAERWH